MKIAFILFKYFPFGGLQRDFFKIAKVCQQRGHEIVTYTMSWQGDMPDNFNITILPAKAITNHKRYQHFEQLVYQQIKNKPVDRVVGFNKMHYLDIYYAADACYEEKAQHQRNFLYRLSSRYKYFYQTEKAVFSDASNTKILLISLAQKEIFKQHYQTQDKRFYLLPPGIAKDRKAPENRLELRQKFRQKFTISDDQLLLLMIGSGFKTKGLDRALLAIANLADNIKLKTTFIVIGQDNPKKFKRYAKKLGLNNQIKILAGRNDIPDFLLGADILIHPAYNENTGTVLLEAMVSGLPVLVTDICGYAHYIKKANAGIVINSPFKQKQLNESLNSMLEDESLRQKWSNNGLSFSQTADIYSMTEHAVNIIEGSKQ